MDYAYLSETVKIKKVSEDERKGVFEVEGLFRGYGLTVGNALRRVLLSSLPGAAVTRFTVKGAGHEFTTIPGMVEDVVELGLNLKQVKFAFYADAPQELHLRAKGEGEVKAKDIAGNAQVKVINPDLHLATLSTKGAELDIVLTVEKGLGYVPVEAQKAERLPIGTIALDAVFSPVVNVNYTVENMRVGDRTDYNRVRVEVETDRTISPSSALHKAANVLIDHLRKIADVEVLGIEGEAKKAKEKPEEQAEETGAK